MNLKRWGATALLAAGVLALGLACNLSAPNLLAKAEPTATPTVRKLRPTFTPRPLATDTPAPTDTLEPTEPPPPTQPPPPPPRPTVRATAKPKPQPTAIPPTRPPQPTRFPFTYKASKVSCTHAGNAYIKGDVRECQTCDDEKISGIKVVMSDSPDGAILDSFVTDVFGEFTFTRDAQRPVNDEKWYVWVAKANGQRDSEVSSQIHLTRGDENNPDACPNVSAFVVFFKP